MKTKLQRINSWLKAVFRTNAPARRAAGPASVVVVVELAIMAGLAARPVHLSIAAEALIDASVLAATCLAVVWGLQKFVGGASPALSRSHLLKFAIVTFAGELLCHAYLEPIAASWSDVARTLINAVAMGLIAWAVLGWVIWSGDINVARSSRATAHQRIVKCSALAMYLILGIIGILFTALSVSELAERTSERWNTALIDRISALKTSTERISRLDVLARNLPGRRSELGPLLDAALSSLVQNSGSLSDQLSARSSSEGVSRVADLKGEVHALIGLLSGLVKENTAAPAQWPHDASPVAEHLQGTIDILVTEMKSLARHEADQADKDSVAKSAALLLALVLMGWLIVQPIVRVIAAQVAWEEETQRKLQDSLARLKSYQQALDHQFIFAATDRSGRIVEANDQFCRISGYDRSELIGRTHKILNSGEHQPGFFAEMWATISAGRTWTGEICNRAKDGQLYWVRSVIFPVFDASGNIEQYAAIRTDVTETKRAHQLLEEAVGAVPDGFVLYDDKDRLIVCNDAYRNIYAASADVIRPGATFKEILEYGLSVGQYPTAGETSEEQQAWLADRLAHHHEPQSDSLQLLPDGRWLQIRERTTKSGYKVGFRTDVTEIQLQAATLTTILQNFPGGIALIDRDLKVRATNPAYRDLLGLPDRLFKDGPPPIDEIFRDNAIRGEYGDGDVEAYVQQRMERILAAEAHIYERRRRDGRVLEVRGAPIPGGGFVTIYLDVTERKQKDEALATALGQLESFAAHAPAAVAMLDRDMRYLAYTNRWLTDYGLEGQNLLGRSHYEVFPNVPDHWKVVHQRGLAGEVERCEDEVFEPLNRSPMHLRWEVRPWKNSHGEIGGIVMLTEDITERVAMEATSRANAEQFRSLFQLAPVGVAMSDAATGRLSSVSESLVELTGYSASELVGRPIQQLLAPEHRQLLQAGQGDNSGRRFGPIEVEYIRKDQRRVPTLLSGIQVSDPEGRPLSLTITQDITERRETEQRLWRLANLDSLTGLANRLLFNERLDSMLKAAQRTGEPFAVGLIDLDKFKEINDSYGHDQGDVLLTVVAERISAVVRETDTVARLGGDEFAFILASFDGVAELRRPLQRMLAAMEEPITIGGSPRRCAMSIGVTVYPSDATSSVDLLKNADIALYRAKAAGRGRVEFFSPEMRTSVERSARLKADVELALAQDQFQMFYQPIFSASANQVVAVEALLRWRHPQLGLVGPEAFREVFEEPKVSAAVGDKVLRLITEDLRALTGRGVGRPRVAINATAADFATGTYLARLEEMVARVGCKPAEICIEITEDMFLGRGAGTTLATIQSLSATGFEIALDDFGTGYASLSHLRQFPIQRLKIDRSFVADMEHDPSDAAIVRAIAFLAQSLDIRVTAEGVDSEGQVEMLRLLGVDSLQGYLFAKPMPMAQLAGVLASGQRGQSATVA